VIEEHADSLQSDSMLWPEQAFTQMEMGVKAPYLPKSNKPTLVLDLDETLIHYDDQAS
jgi:predicted HAD superfamily phosphohydrolase YqeG